ncbi:MAG TPA: cytochrome c oxidase subunit II [Pseudomonadota bacterium]|nr:cytochrome c oxidase subunit II [Pseudomonadota bacterium]
MMQPTTTSMFFPPQASTLAPAYDTLFWSLSALLLVCFVLVISAGVYFVWKYRYRGGEHKVVEISHNTTLEVLWTVVPLIATLILFGWGFRNYMEMVVAPSNAIEVRVTGQKWKWTFEYDNGASSADTFAVPINRPVKLIMSSRDVLHSFFVPGFRNKMDVVPKKFNTMWFQATVLGEQQVFCAEYCGTDHSRMLAKVLVMTDADYSRWLEANKSLGKTPVERGAKLFAGKGGCTACHANQPDSVAGQPNIGPKLWGAFGRKEALADGSSVQIDENYLRESIEYPNAKTVAGFAAGQMPTFKGVLTDPEIGDLIAYIKTLK